MSLIVPDASVILKWVLPDDEPEQEKALLLLNRWIEDKFRILLPPLWLFEVGNVLGLKRPETAHLILQNLLDYEFEECEMSVTLCNRTLQIMKECKTSFYDTVYHALAIQEEGLFVTADEVYFRKAKEKKHIQLLARWVE
jgi:predicted nucleic acid-binding protein